MGGMGCWTPQKNRRNQYMAWLLCFKHLCILPIPTGILIAMMVLTVKTRNRLTRIWYRVSITRKRSDTVSVSTGLLSPIQLMRIKQAGSRV